MYMSSGFSTYRELFKQIRSMLMKLEGEVVSHLKENPELTDMIVLSIVKTELDKTLLYMLELKRSIDLILNRYNVEIIRKYLEAYEKPI